jgi:DtxR family Mn-dependent transcriptional regulator
MIGRGETKEQEICMLSQSIEDYLKSIYKLQKGGETIEKVTTSLISERVEVTAASATNMIKKLAEMNLLKYAPYRGVELTPAGEKIALETIRHHRLIELYLSEALGYPWDAVDAEAERLEHAISEEFEDRIDKALGYPTVGAHGEPIPSKQGTIDEPNYPRLSDLEKGSSAIIRRVSDRNPEMLRYIGEVGLQLGTHLQVCDKAPFSGPITFAIEAGQEQSLGIEVAQNIFVELLD